MAETDRYIGKGFKKDILKVMIMTHLSRKPGYPYALIKAVHHKKIWIMEGMTKNDVYNTMAALEREGFIKSRTAKAGAVIRKNYLLTQKGRHIVKESKKAMMRSFREVIKMM
ncbi:MAG: PadR family transcriptional regulator [Candidatus Marsarchaeota archaeon]|nr:PadR family transcriptional regulator [Candidatus Marsarchaeota archaeon]